jgi:hypothetical protein
MVDWQSKALWFDDLASKTARRSYDDAIIPRQSSCGYCYCYDWKTKHYSSTDAQGYDSFQ